MGDLAGIQHNEIHTCPGLGWDTVNFLLSSQDSVFRI